MLRRNQLGFGNVKKKKKKESGAYFGSLGNLFTCQIYKLGT